MPTPSSSLLHNQEASLFHCFSCKNMLYHEMKTCVSRWTITQTQMQSATDTTLFEVKCGRFELVDSFTLSASHPAAEFIPFLSHVLSAWMGRVSSILSPFLLGTSFPLLFAQDQLYSTFPITCILLTSHVLTSSWFIQDLKRPLQSFHRTHNYYYLNLYLVATFLLDGWQQHDKCWNFTILEYERLLKLSLPTLGGKIICR